MYAILSFTMRNVLLINPWIYDFAAYDCWNKPVYRNDDIGVYILCGLPGQPAGEVVESIRFVQSCGARAIIAEYSPIPGTALWDDAVASSPCPIAQEPLFQNNLLLPCRSEILTFEMYQALKLISRKTKQTKANEDA